MRTTLSLTFVIASAVVVNSIKARVVRETTWQLELLGQKTQQRRLDAVDKLLTVLIMLVAVVLGLQAVGLDGESKPWCWIASAALGTCKGKTRHVTQETLPRKHGPEHGAPCSIIFSTIRCHALLRPSSCQTNGKNHVAAAAACKGRAGALLLPGLELCACWWHSSF